MRRSSIVRPRRGLIQASGKCSWHMGGLGRFGLSAAGGVGPGDPTAITNTAYRFYAIEATEPSGGINYNILEFLLYDDDPLSGGVNRTQQTATTGAVIFSDEAPFSSARASNAFNFFHAPFNQTWVTNAGAIPAWIGWRGSVAGEFDCTSVMLWPRVAELSRAPRDYTIEYSDDGSSWSVAATITGQNDWVAGQPKLHTWASVGGARDWRLNISASNGDDRLGLGVIRFGTSDGVTINNDGRAASWITPDANAMGDADHGIDGNLGGNSVFTSNGVTVARYEIGFAVPFALHTFGYIPNTDIRGMADFSLYGSNFYSGSWTLLQSYTGETATDGVESRFNRNGVIV